MSQAIIDRFKARGLVVHDVRSLLPRKLPNYLDRKLSDISIIAQHWDAVYRPKGYDTLQRIKEQANYHINKDWGGGYGADGLQYHLEVDNAGEVYWCRDFTDVLWHVSDANFRSLGISCHALNQDPTREMAEALQIIYDVLTTQTPEIPAGRANVFGHKEIPSNATACPGNFMTLVLEYRASGKITTSRYIYDFGPIGADLEADMKVFAWPIGRMRFQLKRGVEVWDIANQSTDHSTGTDFICTHKTNIVDVAGRSSTFYIFQDRAEKGEFVGAREEDLWGNSAVFPYTIPEPKVDQAVITNAQKYSQITPKVAEINKIIGG